jgi:endonuclease G
MTSLLPLWATAALASNPAAMLDDAALLGEEPGLQVSEVGWEPAGEDIDASEIVGGSRADDGKWPDAVGVVFQGQYVGCTGTLVGPKVVVTAGHCVLGGFISHVMVGTTDWLADSGEMIEVDEVFEYPNSQSTYDIAVLTLKNRASAEPRTIGLECVLDEHLADGANAQIVGFGLTTQNATGFNTLLNEARVDILDHDCSEDAVNGITTGCKDSIDLGGELIAGGGGIDTCNGDSGGPLYLKTGGDGTYLVGVTSRAMRGSRVACGDGGVYVRPDAVIKWIEQQVGDKKLAYPSCNEAPEVMVDDLVTWEGVPGSVAVAIDDPDGLPEQAQISVVQQAEHGTVEVQGDGSVVYTPTAGFIGEDAFTVEVIDGGVDGYKRTGEPIAVELDVPVHVQAGRPPGMAGCSTTSAAAPSAAGLLGLLGLLGLRRR